MAGLKVVDINKVEPDRRTPPRASWLLVSEKTVGSQNIALGVNETEPGSMVPAHRHESEEEVMLFLEGEGLFVTDDAEIPVKQGICIYNPPGATHKIVNTGTTKLKFVWAYAPQLPSHRAQK